MRQLIGGMHYAFQVSFITCDNASRFFTVCWLFPGRYMSIRSDGLVSSSDLNSITIYTGRSQQALSDIYNIYAHQNNSWMTCTFIISNHEVRMPLAMGSVCSLSDMGCVPGIFS